MEHLLEYLFYGVYATAFAFLLLVLYLNRTNRRLNFLLKKINILSGTDEDEGFPEVNIHKTRRKILKLLITVRHKINNIRIRRYIHEYFLAANIITIIGSILLVVGIAFFVRFPVFGNYLSITARVVIAIGSSLLLIVGSHSMHKQHPAFSSVIMGAAFSILYYSFITAYYIYSLFSIQTAFISVFLTTAFAVILSMAYKRYSLVTLAFLAAYTTPFMVGYNIADSFLLFNYLILLDIGLLILISFKKSLFLNLVGFSFTGIYYLIWLITSVKTQNVQDYDTAFTYLIIFYVILTLINSFSNIIKHKLFQPFELSVIITLNMLVYTAGMYLLSILNDDFRGLFTALMAVFNIAFLYILLKFVRYNQRLIYLSIGLVIVFVTLIPPVELVGRSISMVWALQLILLLWISQKLDVALMKLGATLISVALIVNTLNELWQVMSSINPLAAHKTLLLNSDFLSGFAAAISLLFSIYLMQKEKGKFLFKPVKVKMYQIFAGISAVILLYFSLYVEIKYQLTTYIKSEYARQIFMAIYNFTFALIPVAASAFINQRKIKISAMYLSLGIFLGYLVFYYFTAIKARSEYIAGGGIGLNQFYAVFVTDIILIAVMFINHLNAKNIYSSHKILSQFTLWPLIIFIFISLSLALDHLWIIRYAEQGIMTFELLEKAHLLPYTVLWSALALVLTVTGTIANIRQLRQIAIFSVFVILTKLIIHDLGAMNTQERTIAMITVGGVLTVIALVYQFNQKKFELPKELNQEQEEI